MRRESPIYCSKGSCLDQWDRGLVDLLESHDLADIGLVIDMLFVGMLFVKMRSFGRMRYAREIRHSAGAICI